MKDYMILPELEAILIVQHQRSYRFISSCDHNAKGLVSFRFVKFCFYFFLHFNRNLPSTHWFGFPSVRHLDQWGGRGRLGRRGLSHVEVKTVFHAGLSDAVSVARAACRKHPTTLQVRNITSRSSTMAVDACGLLCKYILIVFNLIFAVVGFAFLGLGLWMRFSANTRRIFEIDVLNSSAFVIGVTVLIVLGSIMLIVVVFGDYGACNEKKSALQIFASLVFFLAIAEFVVGALAYSNRDMVGEKLGEFYISLYSLYVNSQDSAIGVTLTFIHSSLHCCGITGVQLIEIVKQTCPKPSGFMEHFIMSNCPVTIVNVFDSRAPLVLGVFVGTGALLIVAVIFSGVLASQIQRASSSPQYIILNSSTPSLDAPQAYPQHVTVSSNSFPNQDPVVFTPLSVINIPATQP